jgi:hypothetical protein
MAIRNILAFPQLGEASALFSMQQMQIFTVAEARTFAPASPRCAIIFV